MPSGFLLVEIEIYMGYGIQCLDKFVSDRACSPYGSANVLSRKQYFFVIN